MKNCVIIKIYYPDKDIVGKLHCIYKKENLKYCIRWNKQGDYEIELPIGDSYPDEISKDDCMKILKAQRWILFKHNPVIAAHMMISYIEKRKGWE